MPRIDLRPGEMLRVRIRARDVALSLSRPTDVSITNHLPGRLVSIAEQSGPYTEAVVDVGGGITIRSLITRESAIRLSLAPGLAVWALVKTVAFDNRSVGSRHRDPMSGDDFE